MAELRVSVILIVLGVFIGLLMMHCTPKQNPPHVYIAPSHIAPCTFEKLPNEVDI